MDAIGSFNSLSGAKVMAELRPAGRKMTAQFGPPRFCGYFCSPIQTR